MVDQDTLETTINLRKRIQEDKFEGPNTSLEEHRSLHYNSISAAAASSKSNRGNKLFASSSSLNSYALNSKPKEFGIQVVNYDSHPRVVLTNKKRKIVPEELEESNSESDSALEVMDNFNITKILAPIQHPSEVVTSSSVSRIFNPADSQGSQLDKMAYGIIELIEKEQDNVVTMGKLMSVFLGDDFENLLPKNMNLPEYDHGLKSEDLERELQGLPLAERPIIEKGQDVVNQNIEDPFFQLPEFKRDANFGFEPQDAEETRQLLQIVLQRNEEYIRCLQKIRSGCVRTTRLKEKLWDWCTEINGEK